ncbi:MAG: hypothetical protein RQ826_05410 [Xanthomonadales bacterium]|nr:hypothetical protein [Xanthomonadales bacterium]
MPRNLTVILTALVLGAFTFSVHAAEKECKDVRITSSQLVDNAYWLISGNCLAEVTDVALADDFGNGFESLEFVFVNYDPEGNPSIEIPLVTRAGLGSATEIGQYLLQLRQCEKSPDKDKCIVLAEQQVLTPLEPLFPEPVDCHWSAWGECSEECGGGTQTRIKIGPENGGEECFGPDTQDCNTSPCPAVCGNGTVESPEECDDGNNQDGDGCSAACLVETV